MQSIANESNARWVWGASKVRGNAYLVGRPALERPVHLAVVGVEDVPVRPLAPTHVARDGRALVSVRSRARARVRVRVRARARARARARVRARLGVSPLTRRARAEAWWRGRFGRKARNVRCVSAPG